MKIKVVHCIQALEPDWLVFVQSHDIWSGESAVADTSKGVRPYRSLDIGRIANENPSRLSGIPRHILEFQTRPPLSGQALRLSPSGVADGCFHAAEKLAQA